jgi:hypothetical protein
MSGPAQPAPAIATARTLKRKDFSQDDQDDLERLDKVFKRIKTAVPHAPYILSTPSMHPYTYHSRQESTAWMLGHLWRQDEESLQYRTYVYREPCQDCLELQAGEDDDQPDRHESRTANSGAQVAKKKLNLSAFKVKQANGTIAPGSKKVPPALPPTKGISEHANGVNKAEKQVASDQKAVAPAPKR